MILSPFQHKIQSEDGEDEVRVVKFAECLTNPENGLYFNMERKNLDHNGLKNYNLTPVVKVLLRVVTSLTARLLPANFWFFGKSGLHSGFPSSFHFADNKGYVN